MSPFDRLQLLRVLGYAALAIAAALVVVSVTDEAVSTARARVARLAALGPALAAIGVIGANARARARGETLALEALGASPWRLARGLVLGGWVMSALAVLAISTPWADTRALFPVVPSAVTFEPVAGGFRAATAGIAVDAAGSLSRFAAQGSSTPPLVPSRIVAAVWAFSPLALVMPVWAAAPLRAPGRAIGFLLGAAALVGGLHGVAAGRLPAVAVALAGLPLALQAIVGFAAAARRSAALRG